MKADVKAEWVESLRSGKYEQGITTLRYKDSFCCLGILCEVAFPGRLANYSDNLDYYRVDGSDSAYLPLTMIEEVNLTDEQQRSLAQMNDRGDSFNQIADYIEKNL